MGHSVTHGVRRALRHLPALLFVLLSTVIGVAMSGGNASAHTEFSGSTPADGDVVDEPVELVSLVFTGEAEEAGDGFVVLDASGQIREPTSVSTVDNKVFTLSFDPALAGGEIGVRWSVRAADAHPIEGSFSFTVTAPAPTTAPSTAPSTTPEPTTPVATTPEPTTPVATTPAPEQVTPTSAAGPTGEHAMSPEEMASMDEFLAVDASRPGETQATIGRLSSFAGVALAIGGIAFLWTTMRGERAEVRWLVHAIRIVGGVTAVGAAIEYGGVARLADESLTGYWSSSPGFAAALRVVAGVAVAIGLAATIVRVQRPARSLSSATRSVGSANTALHGTGRESTRWAAANTPDQRWVPTRASAVAFVGCALMVVSFWFDGHTVSKGWRPLHAVTNSVHVVAGSVWLGGVVAMAVVMWSRHRRRVPSRTLDLVVRFSSVASVALGAVVVAGLVMAVTVLESFGELTGSEWGQLLLLKSGAAGLAALGGAYNHFRLIPALDHDPDDPTLRDRMRSVVTAEAILLVFVIVVTAWLVTAAT